MGSLVDRLKRHREERGASGFFALAKPPLEIWQSPRQDKVAVVKDKIRILPPTPEMDDMYYAEFWAHYNLGKRKQAVICGRSLHGTCPICDWIADLKDNGVDTSKMGIHGKLKGLVHLVTQSDPETVKIGIFGGGIIDQITAIIVGSEESEDEDDEEVVKQEALGDITDTRKGRWLSVAVTPKNKSTPQNYYKVSAFKNPSPIADSKAARVALLKQRVNLLEMIQEGNSTLEQLEELAERLRSSGGANVSRDEDESPMPTVRKKKKGLKNRKSKDDLAF